MYLEQYYKLCKYLKKNGDTNLYIKFIVLLIVIISQIIVL